MRAEPFNVPEVIGRVMGVVRPMADQKRLAISAEIAPDVEHMMSDRRRIEQILINLLNNGVKFTDHGSVTLQATIDYAFQLTPESSAQKALRVQVRDTGIGIRPDDLKTLFQPFSQVDNGLTRLHEGTGLGLAICRRLVALLGGSITVRSTWSEGSVFTVTLPLELLA
jgi:signal transduction histidine kinase